MLRVANRHKAVVKLMNEPRLGVQRTRKSVISIGARACAKAPFLFFEQE